MIFLAGRDRYTQRTLLRAIHDRLSKQPGCDTVRYRPSRRRPRQVVADIETAAFLQEDYEVEQARLEVRFWYPPGVGYEYYRINWIEPERDLMLGFHQDGDHADLGNCHIQLDHEDGDNEEVLSKYNGIYTFIDSGGYDLERGDAVEVRFVDIGSSYAEAIALDVEPDDRGRGSAHSTSEEEGEI